MPKITDTDAKDWAKRHILADFADGLKIQMGKNPSDLRLALYRSAFEELAKGMSGEELKRFELFGQVCGILIPPFARKSA
jgi:hypothetical protein